MTSGYLIVAYLAGIKLTRSQVLIISILFSFVAVATTLSVRSALARSLVFVSELQVLRPDDTLYLKPWAADFSTVFMIGGMLAALKFMWDIRHPKTK